jgi:tetratricopeptide (TPR) repeat protein
MVKRSTVLIGLLTLSLGSEFSLSGKQNGDLASLVKVAEDHYFQWTKTKSGDSLRKAIRAQRKIVKIRPEDFEAKYFLSNMIYMLSSDDEEAKKIAHEALKLQPTNAKALKLLGRIHVQLGDSGTGLPYLKESVGIFPTDAECWYKVGAVYFENSDLEAASRCFKTAARIRGDAFYLLSAAHTLNTMSQPSAFPFYWAAVRASPAMIDAWNDLTYALSSRRSYKLAEIAARKAFTIQPTAVNLFTVGNNIMSQGLYAKAVSVYEDAVKLEPRNMDILHNLAFTLLLDDRPLPAVNASLMAVDVLLRGNGSTTDPSGAVPLGPTYVVGLANALRRAALLHPPSTSPLAAHLEDLAVAVLASLRQPPTPRKQAYASRGPITTRAPSF